MESVGTSASDQRAAGASAARRSLRSASKPLARWLRPLVSIAISTLSLSAFAAAPTITGFSPTSGPVGTDVTITGTHFSATPSSDIVKFHGTLATVSSATTTEIVATVPSAAITGKITVKVGSHTAHSPSKFTVTGPPPTITGFDPTSGPIGSIVTITGTNYSPNPSGNKVKFHGVVATVSAATTTQLTVTVPTGATTGKITVKVNGHTATSASNFTVTGSALIIDYLDPSSGPIGASVDIHGSNFSATPSANAVSFNGVAATVTTATTSQLGVIVPNGATSGPLTVTVGGQSASLNFDVTAPTLTITSFSPTSGPSGTIVTIVGTNFSATPAEDSVEIGLAMATVTSVSPTQLTAIVGQHAQTGYVCVTVLGQSICDEDSIFEVTTPRIYSAQPLSGDVGDSVMINGDYFGDTPAENIVTFNGTVAAVSAASATQLTVTVPAGATTGPIAVTVNGATGTSSFNFAISPPTITGFTPTGGPGGTVVVITGTHFGLSPSANTVTLNSALVLVTAASANALTVVVPHNVYSGPFTVNVGGASATSAGVFTAMPFVSNVSPNQGSPGATVVIRGGNFSLTAGDNVVTFNGTPTGVTGTGAGQLTTTVPADATSGPVAVSVGGMTGTSVLSFEVGSIQPSITSFYPRTGLVGTSVEIDGANFSNTVSANTVIFNGTPATVTEASKTSLTVTVPSGATTGPIDVTVNGDHALSANSFYVATSGTTLVADGPSQWSASSIAGQSLDFTFNANEGDNLGLGISSVVQTPYGSSQVVASVSRPDGTYFPGTYCQPECSFDLTDLPATGTYTVRLYPSASSTVEAVVDFTNTIHTSISTDAPYTMHLDRLGQVTRVAFPGFAGKSLGLTTRASDRYAINGTSRVLRANGEVLVSRGQPVSDDYSFLTSAALVDLPDTDIYTLITQDTGNASKTALISLFEPTPLTVDGDSVTATADFPEADMFSFTANAGDRLGLGVILPIIIDYEDPSYRSHTAHMSFYGPDGGLLFDYAHCQPVSGPIYLDRSYVDQGCGFDLVSAPLSGEYTLVLEADTTTTYGPALFTATLSTPYTATLSINGPATSLNLNRPGQAGLLSFEGNTGQNVQLNGGSTLNAQLYQPLLVYQPDGNVLAMLPRASNAGAVDLPTLPQTGTYVIEESVRGAYPATVAVYDRSLHVPISLTTLESCSARAGPIATSTTMTGVTPNPVAAGFAFTVGVDVTPISSACGLAQGTVQVTVAGNSCTFDLADANSCSLTAGHSGSQNVDVAFTPSDSTVFGPSSSRTLNGVLITNSPVDVTILNVAPEPSQVGEPYTVQVTVTPVPPATITPTGYVQVRDNAGQYCSFDLPGTSCALTSVLPGNLSVVAGYYGDGNYQGTDSAPHMHFVGDSTPTISAFSPPSGRVGTVVTITGTNFDPSPANDAVTFNGTSATVTSATATQLIAIVPNGATTGPIGITVGASTATSQTDFTVVTGPVITGFTPTSGVIGAFVTITGDGFSATDPTDNVVDFNGVNAFVTQASANQLVALVPEAATSGLIGVSVAGQFASSDAPFTVVPLGTGTASVAITAVDPEPSVAGQPYTVQVEVTAVSPTSPAPTGAVVVHDDNQACEIDLPATSCDLTDTNPGAMTLTADYTGDPVFAPTSSATRSHITNPSTATEICGFDPDAVPDDPPGFVPIEQLSGAVYTPGLAVDIIGNGQLSVTITSPAADSTIGESSVDVTGTFNGPVNTGITVNGVLGYTANGQFVVPNVPLTPGANTLSVVMTTLPGATATTSESITQAGQASPASIHADQAGGLSPLTVRFDLGVAALPDDATVQSVAIDTNGDGVYDYTAATLASLPSAFIFVTPGTYPVAFRVIDSNNITYIAHQRVLVDAVATQRNMLCDVYGYLKDRLNSQDAAGAAQAYQPLVHDRYQALFTTLDNNMPSTASLLGVISNGTISLGYAELTLVRDNADQTRSGYPLRMTQGTDGVWRISEM